MTGRDASQRVRVLDLLRLVAAFQMVQGHTIDAVLALDLRHGALHAGWVWLRGLTSVAFLFLTGLAFHLVSLRHLSDHRRDRAAVRRRLRRAGFLIALGYALHAPLAAVFGRAADAAWSEAVIVDVLQCIGVSLLVLELLALALGSAGVVRGLCGLLAALCLLASPLVAELPTAGALQPLVNYFTPSAGSIFPLLPWAAHVLLGVVLAPWLLAPDRRALRWLAAGLACVVLARLAASSAASAAGVHLQRVGWVMAGGALLEALEPATRRWPPWAWRLSSETLFIYAFHVVLVYGQGVGLAALIGPRLSAGSSVLLAACVIALSFAAALGYRRALPALAARTAPS